MSELRQTALVALREMRERARSRTFQVSLVIMLLLVVGTIALPALLTPGKEKDVGVVRGLPVALTQAISAQGTANGTPIRLHTYPDIPTGEAAVRAGTVAVLVSGPTTLEWPRNRDVQVEAVVEGAMQVVAVGERALNAGISPGVLQRVLTPVPITSVELSKVAGRSTGDELAATLMTVALFFGITTYGALVLTGVTEEKASRVVEVLLARMRARTLLAGKIAGIGLLGLGQFVLTAVVALVTVRFFPAIEIPAVSAGVLSWAVVWFVLGYALYATAYGVLGSLASRTEDAQSVAGPAIVVLVAAYFASFLALGRPDSGLAVVLSYLPPTAPLAMPSRLAIGAASWWEPFIAAAVTALAVLLLVRLGGRVYSRAILHTGPTLHLRDVLRGGAAPAARP